MESNQNEEVKKIIDKEFGGIEPDVSFKLFSDKRVFAIKEEGTGETVFEISGYDLAVSLNRGKIKSLDDVDNILEGIKELYKKMIITDLITPEEK